MSASQRPFQAVLFDLDGVVVDTARLHFVAWKRLAIMLAVPFDEERNEALKGVDRLGSLELLLGSHAGRYDMDEKQRLAQLKNRWYVQSLDSIGSADLLPGAEAALDQVRRAGLKVALASASRNAAAVLDRLGIANRFDAVVDPAGIPRGKPAPDLFLSAAQELETPPELCLGIEDAAVGIAALKTAGMGALGIGDPALLRDADWVLPALDQFRLSDYRSDA